MAAFDMTLHNKILCRNCEYYFVTWDKLAPHGCRAMGFKSLKLPSRLVFTISGSTCLKFKQKVCHAKK